ncbi:MAG: hypothetical protein R3F34_09105 [Planctomycetota bacterium]
MKPTTHRRIAVAVVACAVAAVAWLLLGDGADGGRVDASRETVRTGSSGPTDVELAGEDVGAPVTSGERPVESAPQEGRTARRAADAGAVRFADLLRPIDHTDRAPIEDARVQVVGTKGILEAFELGAAVGPASLEDGALLVVSSPQHLPRVFRASDVRELEKAPFTFTLRRTFAVEFVFEDGSAERSRASFALDVRNGGGSIGGGGAEPSDFDEARAARDHRGRAGRAAMRPRAGPRGRGE